MNGAEKRPQRRWLWSMRLRRRGGMGGKATLKRVLSGSTGTSRWGPKCHTPVATPWAREAAGTAEPRETGFTASVGGGHKFPWKKASFRLSRSTTI